jgi:hypothetical protein
MAIHLWVITAITEVIEGPSLSLAIRKDGMSCFALRELPKVGSEWELLEQVGEGQY